MKKLLFILAGVAFSTGLFAAEPKEVTLKGTGTCAKCNLGTADKCTNVLQVTGKNDKVRTYVFAKNVSHGDFFCKGETPGLVVKGTVERVDGKLILTAASVEKEKG